MKIKGYRVNMRIALLILVVLVLLAPLLKAHFEVLQSRVHYQIYPLILLSVAIVFTIRLRKATPSENVVKPWVLTAMLSMPMLLLPIVFLYYTSWVAAFAGVLLLGSVAAYISSIWKIENLFGVWCLLLLLIRPPDQIEGRILRGLQDLSSQTASILLDFLGTAHVVQGNLMALLDKDIELDKICNGHISLVGVMCIISLWLVLNNRRWLHCSLLLVGGLVVAWALNVVRIVLVVMLFARADVDLMSGVLGWLFLVLSIGITLAMVLGFDRLISFFMGDIQSQSAWRDAKLSKLGKRTVKTWDWFIGTSIAKWLQMFRTENPSQTRGWVKKGLTGLTIIYLGAVMVFEGVILHHRTGDTLVKWMNEEGELSVISREDVVFLRPGWEVLGYTEEKRDFSSIWGAYSSTWRLRYDNVTCIVSLDYPFDKWHDVKRCYTKEGWKIFNEDIIRDSGSYKWGVSQTELTVPNGDYGLVMCSHCDQNGRVVQPKPTDHRFSMVMHYLHPKQWSPPFAVTVDKDSNTYYQTQLMLTASYPIEEEMRDEIRLMYAEFRNQVREAIQSDSGQK